MGNTRSTIEENHSLPVKNIRHSITVRFDQDVDLNHRVTLVERLQRIYGVISAVFDSCDERNLTVRFQESSLTVTTLLDYLKLQGLSATVIGLSGRKDTATFAPPAPQTISGSRTSNVGNAPG